MFSRSSSTGRLEHSNQRGRVCLLISCYGLRVLKDVGHNKTTNAILLHAVYLWVEL